MAARGGGGALQQGRPPPQSLAPSWQSERLRALRLSAQSSPAPSRGATKRLGCRAVTLPRATSRPRRPGCRAAALPRGRSQPAGGARSTRA
eukprot:scaffold129583_cov42-Phaeocystis_antarctica.AAC.1